MAYCRNCGKLLEDGEICSCTAPAQEIPAANMNNNAAPQNGQPYNGGIQPPPPQYPNNGQPYPNQPYPNQPYPQGYPAPQFGQQMAQPPKKSYAWVLAIILPIAGVVLLLMMAILVPAMLGYTKKSKLSSVNSDASIFFRAANTAMVELDEEGKKVKGYYIISSDDIKNQAVPFDTGEFREKLMRYFDKIGNYEYFIICRNGCAEYAAIAPSWDNKKDYIGTYPPSRVNEITLYSADGSSSSSDDKMNLNDLYKDAYRKYTSAN
ncbi:MAG: hypothetical protein J6X85_00815 [Ruminococcus sp.]|nr:hypothetical protein [Ruminococcus sp.]